MWQKEQWIKNKKQEVFFGCLKCLGEAMPLPIDKHGRNVSIPQRKEHLIEAFIDNDRLLGIMQSLQYVGSWLTTVEGYCSDDTNALGVRQCRQEFLRCLDLVLHDELWSVTDCDGGVRPDQKMLTLRRDYGLSRAHQDAYECVMNLAATELLIGRVPTLKE